MSQPSPFASATQLARLVARRDIGARELLELYLARVKRLNPAINAVVVLNAAAARRRADALDQLTGKRSAKLGPLHGVPMTVKESFDVKGLPTTLGFTEHTGNRAKADGLAVRRLQEAGAVVFGKTNVPVALADWQSFNPVYGTTSNPWDTTLMFSPHATASRRHCSSTGGGHTRTVRSLRTRPVLHSRSRTARARWAPMRVLPEPVASAIRTLPTFSTIHRASAMPAYWEGHKDDAELSGRRLVWAQSPLSRSAQA